jgi:hypothetical protein
MSAKYTPMDAIYFLAFAALVYLMFFGLIFIVEFVSLLTLTKALKFRKADYMTVLIVSLFSTGISVVLQFTDELLSTSIDPTFSYIALQLLGLLFYLALIKYFYKENWKKTIAITLIVFVIEFVIVFSVSFLLSLFLGPIEMTETFIPVNS